MSLAMDEITLEELQRLHILGFVAITGNGHLAAVVEEDKAERIEQERAKYGY
ncbi:MAG: hypothetical protein J6Y89_11170 [Lachnospiraceae bacterium]|nr:hypothetical protein [Lachnospiraceae bacterium]